MLQAIETLGGIAGRRLELVAAPRRAGRSAAGRQPTRRVSAPISAGRRAPRSRRGSRLSGAGPLIGSRPHDGRQSGVRAGGRAGGRPRLRLAAHPGCAGGCRSAASSIGAVVGLALALSGGSVWRAETIVYLGQPFAPLGGGQIQSLATNPRTVGEIIRSQAALEAASEASGVPVSQLRSSISTKELTAIGQLRGINPLMEIAVKALGRAQGRAGRRGALRSAWSTPCRVYVTDKVELLESQVAVSRGAARGRRGADHGGPAPAGHAHPGPVDPARAAPPPELEPQLGDHDRRRAPDGAPGRPLRGAAAASTSPRTSR